MPGRKAAGHQGGGAPGADDAANEVLLCIALRWMHLVFAPSTSASASDPAVDAIVAPAVRVEVLHAQDEPSVGPAATAVHISARAAAGTTEAAHSFSYQLGSTHRFRYLKGRELLSQLLNTHVRLRVHHATTGAVIADAPLDLLPLGLSAGQVEEAPRLAPAGVCDALQPFRVLPGSHISVALQLLHQPHSPGAAPASSDAAAAHVAFSAVAPEDAGRCNVLQFCPKTLAPVPASFIDAAAVAAGALTCCVALHLPGVTTPLVVACGVVEPPGRIAWTGAKRVWLSPNAAAALKANLESGDALLVEVARQLAPESANLADPAWAAYHGLLRLECGEALLEPGECCSTVEATFLGQFDAHSVAHGVPGSALPPYIPPAGPRVKAVEEAPPMADGTSPPPCAWQAAGSKLAVQLRLARSLNPAWRPPCRPALSLSQMLPKQEVMVQPPPAAREIFKAEVAAIVDALLSDSCTGGSVHASSKDGQQPGHLLPAAHAAPSQPGTALLDGVRWSGRYAPLRQRLQCAVAAVVRERRESAAGTGGRMREALLQGQVYADLVADLRAVLADTLPCSAVPASMSEGARPAAPAAAAAATCAAEWEAVGDLARARLVLQDAVALSPSAEAWCAYGIFTLLHGSRARALECVHAALALDTRHAASLAVLACLHLQQAAGGGAAAASLLAAITAAHELKDATPGSACAWALLSLAYKQQGAATESDARSCHQEVLRLAKTAAATAAAAAAAATAAAAAKASSPGGEEGERTVSSQPVPIAANAEGPAASSGVTHWLATSTANVNGYLAAAELLAHLRLAAPAERALGLAAGFKDVASRPAERMTSCRARIAHADGHPGDALKLLAAYQAAREGARTGDDPGTLLLAGDIHFQGGKWVACKQHLQRAWQALGDACPLTAQLRLGECLLRDGEAALALDTFQEALERAPSACAWLGCGMAALQQGAYPDAEVALSEANRLDPQHPRVWSYLALLALRQGHEHDAQQAGEQALARGLEDVVALAALGEAWAQRGRWRAAEAFLGLALQQHDSCRLRCQLAGALLAQRKCAACEEQLVAAEARAPGASAEDTTLLAQCWDELRTAWPGTG